MNTLIPEHLNKNKVKRQSLQRPAPVPFAPPSPELPEIKDNKHSIKVKINKQTDECVYVFHGGIPETYLQYIKICENLVRKKDIRAMFDRYEKKEAPAQEDINVLDVNKPEAETGNTTVSDTSDRLKEHRNPSMDNF